MQTPSKGLFRILIGSIVALVAVLVALYIYFDGRDKQNDFQLAQSVEVNQILSVNIKEREDTISNLEAEVSDKSNQIDQLSKRVGDLENAINSYNNLCQSITYEEFDRLVRLGTTYVMTPEKMGWDGYWTIRENVLFERDHELARGYELRYNLTPDDNTDEYQEIHSTLRAFSSADLAMKAYESKVAGDNKTFYDSSIDLGIPIAIWLIEGDPATTVTLALVCGDMQADFKIKYLTDIDQAIQYLEEGASLFFHDISIWTPVEIPGS